MGKKAFKSRPPSHFPENHTTGADRAKANAEAAAALTARVARDAQRVAILQQAGGFAIGAEAPVDLDPSTVVAPLSLYALKHAREAGL